MRRRARASNTSSRPRWPSSRFLAAQANYLERATDADLTAEVRAYAAALSARARDGDSGDATTNAAPPSFEGEVVWRAHLLRPTAYARACAAAAAAAAPAEDAVVAHAPAPVEAYNRPAEECSAPPRGGGGDGDDDDDDLGWLGLDLVAALRRQQHASGFVRGMLAARAERETEPAVRAALGEYRAFLTEVLRAGPHHHGGAGEEKKAAVFAPPSAMADLVWHTHMLFPRQYAAESRRLAGCFLDHDDDAGQLQFCG